MAEGTAPALAYFQLALAIQSTIGLFNVILGLMVAGILGGFSATLLVPIITSAACALANGIAYIAYHGDYPVVNKAVADVIANLGWLVSATLLLFLSICVSDSVSVPIPVWLCSID